MSHQSAHNPYAPAQPGPADLSQPLYGASFGEAVKRFFKKYATFSGRASRSEYWWYMLFNFVVYTALAVITNLGVNSYGEPTGLGIIAALLLLAFSLGVLVPGIALLVRRLHDGGFSGWMALLGLVPFVGGLIILVFTLLPSKPEGARFGAGAQQQYAAYPQA